ncbi:MAG: transglycosylase domain-containing protein [Spirochaetota bacterium]
MCFTSLRARLTFVPLLLTGLAAVPILLGIVTVSSRSRLVHPPPTPIIEDRHGRFLTEGLGEYDQLGFWEMPNELPERVTRALLVTEDKRFYDHRGIDVRAVGRALVNNLSGGPVQGASTIAMQVARLQRPAARVITNKLAEMLTAVNLVQTYGRDAVLRHYMRIVPLGHQIHGFAYAARRYFRKPVEDLSWTESAVLAALPQSPSHTDLFSPSGFERAAERARMILGLLREAGELDEAEHEVSIAQLESMHALSRESRPVDALHYIHRLIDQPGFYRASYAGPIRSSLDLDMQFTVSLLARETLKRLSVFHAGNISAIVLDAETGEILAYVGSDDYFSAENAGSINYAHTRRSSGSILKPFLYAYGLDAGGFTSGSIVPDIPLNWMDPEGEYVVSNFDGLYLGPMLYGNALANSRNIAAVRVLDHLGTDRVYDLFREVGLHDAEHSWDYYGYGMVLGGLYVTLEDVVRAYGYLAGDGRDYSLDWTGGDASDPEPIRDERGVLPQGLLSEDSVRLVTGYLSDPTRRLPSFPRLSVLEFRFPVAIKTGTSQGFRDAWAVGYSRRYVIGAWTGHPDNSPMNHVAGSVIADLVHELFVTLQPEQREGFEYVPFPPPRNAVPLEISTLSGKLATEATPSTQVEYFVRGTEPTEYSSVYQRFSVDRRSDRLATTHTPPDEVVTKRFPVLPPEYASWAAEHGMAPPGPSVAEPHSISVAVRYPPEGARFVIDPTIPDEFQTIGLEADVEPRVSEVVWVVDGKEIARTGFPYSVRLPLHEGEHRIRVRFPRAFVESEEITFTVVK